MNSESVAVVILNWNGLADTAECIRSVLKSSYPNLSVILVDNNSQESPYRLSKTFRDVTLVLNSSNLGYAGGNNVGIRRALENEAAYIWILNNDTVVEKTTLSLLVDMLEQCKNAGAVTNRIGYLNGEKEKTCWYAGGYLHNGIPGHYGSGKPMSTVEKPESIDYLSGCSFLVRSDVVRQLGGFDEKFFCYSEDTDFSLRIKNAGYELAYAHNAIVWHKVSASFKRQSDAKLYYKFRNIIYLHKKHGIPKSFTLGWILKSLRYCVSLLLKHRRMGSAIVVLEALLHGLRGNYGKSSKY